MNNLLLNFYEKIKYFNLILLIILFPVNQQLHIRPFPNVEGLIIDYLMLKISIPEVLLFTLTIFNLNWIIKSLKELSPSFKKYWYLLSILIFGSIVSVYKSNYLYLSIYENLIFILIVLNLITIKNFQKINYTFLLSKSIKFWMVILLLLGSLQFYKQESVFDSYYLIGEFSYTSDNYHIKQDGLLIKNLIPAYGIFSHSNIYGAFFLICSMFLHLIKKNNIFFTLISIAGVTLSGSLNILLGLIIFFVFFYLKMNYRILVFYILFIFLTLNYMSLSFKNYEEDLSVYRRVYMIHLSNNEFVKNPLETLIGFGYYNYFKNVSQELYYYEIIRFFQPPHNVFYLLIWNYGLIFVSCLVFLFIRFLKNVEFNFKIFFLVLIAISMFDHFLFTNHQLKMLLFLILPYSLNRVFSIRIN